MTKLDSDSKKKKPVVKVKHILNKSKAEIYTQPNLFLVSTELVADEPEFTPVYNEPNLADVFIIAPFLDHLGVQALRLNHRSILVVDCGFSVKLPKGFQIRGATKKEWANRGLFVSQVYLENDRLKLTIVNIGTESPLVINHKSCIAQVWVEPVYFFDWKK